MSDRVTETSDRDHLYPALVAIHHLSGSGPIPGGWSSDADGTPPGWSAEGDSVDVAHAASEAYLAGRADLLWQIVETSLGDTATDAVRSLLPDWRGSTQELIEVALATVHE